MTDHPDVPDAPKRSWLETLRGLRVYIGLAAALLLIVAAALIRVIGDAEVEPGATAISSQSSSPTSSLSPPALRGPQPPEVDPALMRGSAEAPVTMVVFSDYRCPYCAAFATDQQPLLVREYVETGQLRLVWRDYPYLGEESVRAAVAARAAGRQDAFWDYHAALYAAPDTWSQDGASPEGFARVAADVGLDVDRFQRDMDDPELRNAVEEDFDFGLGLGVPGTPAFLINGKAFFGAQPIVEFQKQIAAAIDEAG